MSPRKTLIVSLVNTPDFFARAKAYPSYKVFVACEDNQIVGSAAYGIREAFLNGPSDPLDMSFNTSFLLITVERVSQGNFTNILEIISSNMGRCYLTSWSSKAISLPRDSLKVWAFNLYRTLTMPGLVIYKKMDVAHQGTIRQIGSEEFF